MEANLLILDPIKNNFALLHHQHKGFMVPHTKLLEGEFIHDAIKRLADPLPFSIQPL